MNVTFPDKWRSVVHFLWIGELILATEAGLLKLSKLNSSYFFLNPARTALIFMVIVSLQDSAAQSVTASQANLIVSLQESVSCSFFFSYAAG